MQSTSIRAFSLVELSIVLVILGLLVGGVLSGQSLIRAAELRSASSEYGKYMSSIQSFRDKYFAIPGDMANATSFWGKNTTACNAQPGTAATPGTCNGNGDGALAWPGIGQAENPLLPRPGWQHLGLAQLIEGTYTGMNNSYQPGINMPKSRLGDSKVWDMGTIDFGGLGGWDNSFGQKLTLMLFNTVINPGTGGPTGVMSASEAWNLDTKMDDGKPGMGNIRAYLTYDVCYLSGGTSATTEYLLTNTDTNGCGLYMNAQ